MLDSPAAPSDVELEPAASDGETPSSQRLRSRRSLFTLPLAAGLAASAACTAPGRQGPPPADPQPPPLDVSAEVAVDKLTFGPTPGLVDAVKAMGVASWIERQLTRAGLSDAEHLVSSFTSLTNTNLQNYQLSANVKWDLHAKELDAATIIRATRSEAQLYEVMCDFWSNHFNTWRSKTWMGFLKNAEHREVVRAHALGRFSDMLVASAHSSAMLDYLDNLPNDASTPGGVNENYARELMELHTLGIVNGTQVHTEDDVHQVAKLISGWSIDWNSGPNKYGFRFAPWMHSLDAVSVLNGAFERPARRYGQGYDDGVRFLQVLANHPATARHICWKLCRRFLSDDPPMSLVESAAQVFLANGTAIVPTLRHIFVSAEFAASGNAKVRRPFEQLIATLRALNATFGTAPDGKSISALRSALDVLGQPIFERVSPDGYPDVNPYWVSSAALLERWRVTGEIARNGFGSRKTEDRVEVNPLALLPNPLPATVGELVSRLGTDVANIAIPGNDVTDLCNAVGIPAASAATALSTNLPKLSLVLGLILCHPLFQRR